MKESLLKPADILVPDNIPISLWSVVACDQYTSQPEYWEHVRKTVGTSPSAYHLVYPEVYLKNTDPVHYTQSINDTMARYLDEGVLRCIPQSYLLVQRALRSGSCRWGLMAALDLEQYDYHPGSHSRIRATEGTVAERIPPRVAIRKDAPLELPHVMVLIDDPNDTVLGHLKAAAHNGEDRLTLQYEGELMEQSGAVCGWSLGDDAAAELEAAVAKLPAPDGMVFAMGDGNHSLATAKECFEELKKAMPQQEWEHHPARYALVEIVNLYDESLEFEPIHRVMTKVNPQHLLESLMTRLDASTTAYEGAQCITICTKDQEQRIYFSNPSSPLEVGVLQPILDEYLASNGGEIDYIHGDDVVRSLSMAEDAIGFLLPPMDKSLLFPAVVAEGVLPRKTFSMGNAEDKRFYLECRKIK
ncbi:MAG: DUF1015 domain-containing protein [Angelakisella sp.]|nr:DUF1015 domain-containing protein [Angelakisella sp.]